MRIAQVAPLFEAVPPQLYGGTERVVSHLTEELVRRGHDVTLFASGDSQTAATLVPVVPRAMRLGSANRDLMLVDLIRERDMVFNRAGDFDVIHCHVDYLAFPFGNLVTTPHARALLGLPPPPVPGGVLAAGVGGRRRVHADRQHAGPVARRRRESAHAQSSPPARVAVLDRAARTSPARLPHDAARLAGAGRRRGRDAEPQRRRRARRPSLTHAIVPSPPARGRRCIDGVRVLSAGPRGDWLGTSGWRRCFR